MPAITVLIMAGLLGLTSFGVGMLPLSVNFSSQFPLGYSSWISA
jgi:hypothetical protein